MSQQDYERARTRWILDIREVLQNQLNLLNGGPLNPFHGAGTTLIFADTAEAQNVLSRWIEQIDTSLGVTAPEDR